MIMSSKISFFPFLSFHLNLFIIIIIFHIIIPQMQLLILMHIYIHICVFYNQNVYLTINT